MWYEVDIEVIAKKEENSEWETVWNILSLEIWAKDELELENLIEDKVLEEVDEYQYWEVSWDYTINNYWDYQ